MRIALVQINRSTNNSIIKVRIGVMMMSNRIMRKNNTIKLELIFQLSFNGIPYSGFSSITENCNGLKESLIINKLILRKVNNY